VDIRAGAVLDGPDSKTITIEALLGRGGFGQVFVGQMSDSIKVAVKTVLTALLNDSELATLQNEAKLAIKVVHPNVVRVLYVNDGKVSAGRPPYLVTEFVDGGNLRAVIDSHKKAGKMIAVDELRAIYAQVADGMEAVNAHLVHRDLKPDNVLVDAKDRRLKIGDFGLAKLADAATRSETFKGWGTRAYQAPEAFENKPNTSAMDVYAAGVMFYELATLSWPVQPDAGDNTPMAWRNAHLLNAPKDIRALRPDLPQDLVQLILKMLDKNPSKRPTWNDVKERLSVGSSPATAGPDVRALIAKATTTFTQATAAESRKREERERAEERRALLEQAFREPIEVLQSLVDAFNTQSGIGKLELSTTGALSATVAAQPGHPRLIVGASIIDDLDLRHNGVARIVGKVWLDPTPRPSSQDEMIRDPESFGGFNLVYRVPNANERFGTWTQFRFEISPLLPKMVYPRWFALGVDDFIHQLRMLQALGEYQHQQRALDHDWFRALLLQVL
jgi:serine/threonine protein kinase